MLLPHYAGGRHAAVDVCVVPSLQSGLVAKAAEEAGHALKHRYKQKWEKYGEACSAEGICFTPAPFEVLGGLHEASVRLVKGLGQALARAGGQDESTTIQHLFQRLSILLMQGNSQLILSRTPEFPAAQVDGHL